MAVTIHNTPQLFTPSDNPVNWTFSSDQTAQPNFVFLVEVYVNAILTANELVFPDNGINGRFDASSYASNACVVPTISSVFIEDANNNAEIHIVIIERYGDPVIDHLSATATAVTVFKSKLDDDDFVDFDHTNYLINPGIAKKFLNNFPGGYVDEIRPLQRKEEDEQFRLMIMNNEANVTNLKIELFDSDDGSVGVWIATPLMDTNKITILNLTTSVVIAATTLTQGNFDAASYMTISAGSVLSTFFVDFNTNCKFTHYKRIHFLTHLGSIESLSFDLISRPEAKIKSFGYEKEFGEWDGSDFNYTKEQGRSVDFAKVSDRQMTVLSDWINEDVQHWLVRNLYESPVVFVEEDSTLRRRKIMNSSWKDNYNENDTLFQEMITLKLDTKTSMTV